MDDVESFGYWVRRWRKARDLTQDELARRVGCSVSTIRKIEVDERRPSQQAAERIAAVLELPPAERRVFLAVAREELAPDWLPAPPTAPVTPAGAAPGSSRLRRSSTPRALTPLVGREQEVARVRHHLLCPEVRLVTLTGPGGTGKTRLAMQVATEAVADFPDGVYFVDLAPVSDPAFVASTIASTLGVNEAGGRPLVKTLSTYLAERHLLLVLDNFEQVVEAAALLTALLTAGPSVKMLVTSRELLRVSGEHHIPVPPLAVPDAHHRAPLETLQQAPAMVLFVQRAQAVRPDFRLMEATAEVVAAICTRLDGLPLAIELAAARSTMLPPQAILARLDHPLALLTSGSRDLPARQRTLRDTIAWSYRLLTPGEQGLFARLGVFRGGWTLAAAEAVCNAASDLPLDVLEGLQSLIDKNMVRPIGGANDELRFRMLETLREYALECLAVRGETEYAGACHARFYVTWAEAAEAALSGAGQVAWLDQLEVEHDNLRAALGWSMAAQHAEAQPTGLRMAGALGQFWELRGYWSEGRAWLTQALDSCQGELATGPLTRARAKALYAIGSIAKRQGDYIVAQARLAESRDLYQTCGDTRGAAYALIGLGEVTWVQSGLQTGRAQLEQSVAIFRDLDDQRGQGLALLNLGDLVNRQGESLLGRAYLEEALALWRRQEDPWGIAQTLVNLAWAVLEQGDGPEAQALLEESLARWREIGDKRGVAWTLNDLGEFARWRGDYQQALPLYEAAMAGFREVDSKPGLLCAFNNLGYIALHQGELKQASTRFVDGLTLGEKLGDKVGVGVCLVGLAVISARDTQSPADSYDIVRLLGAAESLLGPLPERLVPPDRKEYERAIGVLRSSIDEDMYRTAWVEGRAMSLEQAAAYAFELARHRT